MVKPEDIGSIEIDMNLYRHEIIIFRDKNGKTIHVIKPRPGKANKVFNEVYKKWIEEIK